MRAGRLALLFALSALALVLTPSAAALDLCEEPHCQPPAGEQNTFYEWEFEAEEGCVPYFFKHINGTLPNGLVVTDDGELEGTPTQAGNFDFWVTLNDNGGPQNPACIYKGAESQAHFFLTIIPDLAVTTESLPAGTPGQAYSAQLTFSNPEAGWRVIWDVIGGALPAGLNLSESGLISGTPSAAGVSTVVVRAREPFRRFGEKTLTLRVGAALTASSTLGAGEVGLRYSGRIQASGGIAPLAWSVASGSLPAGLTLDQATGAVRGVPRSAGASALTFAVTDASGQRVTVPANLRIVARLAITTGNLPSASVGDRYLARLRASGGLAPKTWRIVRGSLPAGVRLGATTGVLSGAPQQAGVYRVTVQARDRLGARSTKTLRLTVTG
jgi:Putative Ig domain